MIPASTSYRYEILFNRPIFKNLSQARINIAVNLMLPESKNIPATFTQVGGLPFVSSDYFSRAMPVVPVAEKNQLPFKDDEVHYPPAVKRNLLGKINVVRRQQLGNLNLYPGPTSKRLEIGNATNVGTQIRLEALIGTHSGGELEKGLSAIAAFAFNLRFELGMVLASVAKLASVIVRARFRACSRLVLMGIKGLLTDWALLLDSHGDRRISSLCDAVALGGAILPTPVSNLSEKYFPRSSAYIADNIQSGIGRVLSSLWKSHVTIIIVQSGTYANA